MVRTRRLRRVLPAALLLGLLAVPVGAEAQEGSSCTPGSGVDLSNRRPSPEEAGPQMDLRCANAAGADLSGFDLTQADLSNADLSGANLSNARLTQTTLVGADLTGATLTGAELTQVELQGAILAEVDLSGERLTQAEFRGIEAPGINLANAELNQADFTDANLAGADLSGATLVQADLVNTNLSGADLSGADLGQAEARGADFSDADLSDADLTQADLTNADLSNADASGAELIQADIDGADLSGLKGVLPLADYLLYGAAGLFVLLAVLSVRRALAPERPGRYAAVFAPAVSTFGVPTFGTTAPPPAAPTAFGTSTFGAAPAAPAGPAPAITATDPFGNVTSTAGPDDLGTLDPDTPVRRRVVPKLLAGVIGSAIAVLGLHLAVGGAIGTFVDMWNPLWAVCDGPACGIGVDSGPLGLTFGVFVAIFGFFVRARD